MNACSNALNSAALGAFEKVQLEGGSEKVLPEAAQQILHDRDVLMAVLQSSQDYKAAQIDTVEDECVRKETASVEQISRQLSLEEKRRYRNAISQMLAYIERNMTDADDDQSEHSATLQSADHE